MALSRNVITGQDYLSIATFYATARDNNVASVEYLYDAVYQVVLLTQVDPTRDLIGEFYNSYLINADIYRSPSTYLSAVRSINNHVINRAGIDVSDLNDYLTLESIQVPLGWAELCKSTGILVCRSNIQGQPTAFSDGTATPVCS